MHRVLLRGCYTIYWLIGHIIVLDFECTHQRNNFHLKQTTSLLVVQIRPLHLQSFISCIDNAFGQGNCASFNPGPCLIISIRCLCVKVNFGMLCRQQLMYLPGECLYGGLRAQGQMLLTIGISLLFPKASYLIYANSAITMVNSASEKSYT